MLPGARVGGTEGVLTLLRQDRSWLCCGALPAKRWFGSRNNSTLKALNRILRKALKTRGPLPTDEAALKLLYLAVRNAKATWGRAHRDWMTARMQLAIHFEGRLG